MILFPCSQIEVSQGCNLGRDSPPRASQIHGLRANDDFQLATISERGQGDSLRPYRGIESVTSYGRNENQSE